MGVVDNPVQDGVSDGGVPEALVPMLYRQLAGNQRGSTLGTVFKHFQQIAGFRWLEVGEAPIIENEQLSFPERFQKLEVLAISLGDGELTNQCRDPIVSY